MGCLLGFLGGVSNSTKAADNNGGRSWAVVIGIEDYATEPPLKFAEDDGRAMATLLNQLGFTVLPPLYNQAATHDAILEQLLGQLVKKVQPQDRVVVYFSGHGITYGPEGGKKLGYLLPVDGSSTKPYLAGKGISMKTIQDIASVLKAKHVLFLIDACYGGMVGAHHKGSTALPVMSEMYLNQLQRERGKWVLTAGGADQRAVELSEREHGAFTYFLLEGLGPRRPADLDNNQLITTEELFQFVKSRVFEQAQLQGERQVPELWNLSAGDKGQMVFAYSQPHAVPRVREEESKMPAVVSSNIEGRWMVEKSDTSPEMYFHFFRFGKKQIAGALVASPLSTPGPFNLLKGKYEILNVVLEGNNLSFHIKHIETVYQYGGSNTSKEHLVYFAGRVVRNSFKFQSRYQGDLVTFTATKIHDLTELQIQNSPQGHYTHAYILPGHEGGVRSLSMAPDPARHFTGGVRLMSTGLRDGKVKHWDLALQQEEWTFYSFPSGTPGVASFRAEASEGVPHWSAVEVISSEQEIRFVEGWFLFMSGSSSMSRNVNGVIHQVQLTPDGKYVAIENTNEEGVTSIQIRSYNSGGVVYEVLPISKVVNLALSWGGEFLAITEKEDEGATAKIRVWEKGKVKWEQSGQSQGGALAFSRDGKTLASGGVDDGIVNLWDVNTGQLQQTLPGNPEAGISVLQFSNSGDLLASGGPSHLLHLWELPGGRLKQNLNNERAVSALAFSQNDRILAAGSPSSGEISIWARPLDPTD